MAVRGQVESSYRYKMSFECNENIWNEMVMVVQIHEYMEKPLNFTVCELYLSQFLKEGMRVGNVLSIK